MTLGHRTVRQKHTFGRASVKGKLLELFFIFFSIHLFVWFSKLAMISNSSRDKKNSFLFAFPFHLDALVLEM